MSKRKLFIIEDEVPFKKTKYEQASKTLKDSDSYEESLSSSMASLSIEEDDFVDHDFKEMLKEECDEFEYEQLNPILDDICKNMLDRKITISKILKSNLLQDEKEKALELYGVLMDENPNTIAYIELHKLLQDMIAGSSITSSSANQSLKSFQEDILSQTPTLDKIMAAKLSRQDKMMAIQLFQTFYQIGLHAGGLYSEEWFSARKRIIDVLSNTIDNQEEFEQLEKEETKLQHVDSETDTMKKKILKLNVVLDRKKKLYDMYQNMIQNQDERDRHKASIKLKWLLNLPYDKVSSLTFDIDDKSKIQEYCDSVYTNLSSSIYGMNEIKEKLLIHINNRIHHKKTMSILALKGMPGVGKTRIIQSLSEATGIPYAKISLGGVSDTTLLFGHNQVWENSGPGIIMQHLSRTQCSDMIILLDEIDKIGTTDKGLEVQHALLHILDQTQNQQFNDAYLDEFPHDISRIWFIATLNDDHSLSQPLKDRLDIVEVPSYTKEEIVNIISKHILPQANKDCGLKTNDITISDSAAYSLITSLLSDIKKSGMRLVEKSVKDMVLKLSFLNNTNTNVSFKLKDFKGFPYTIEKKTLKAFLPKTEKATYSHHMMYS
jgi:ATP-dependent Lon protease